MVRHARFVRAAALGSSAVSDVFYGPTRQGPVVAISVPGKEKRRGDLCTRLRYPPKLRRLSTAQPQSANVLMLVIDGTAASLDQSAGGRAIARTAKPPFDKGSALPRGRVETLTFDGIPAFFAYRRSDLTDWTIAVGIPTEKILEPARPALSLCSLCSPR